jgi:hypothetical protein
MGLLRDGKLGFQPTERKAKHLASVGGRVNRHFEENSLAGMVFLDVAKAFEKV